MSLPKEMKAQQIGLILPAGFALGSAASVAPLGVLEIHPVALVALRFGIASLAFAATLPVLHIALPHDSHVWRDILLVGLTQGFQLPAFTFALQYISSAVVTIFIALAPFFTAIMAHLWLTQEQLNPRKWLGLITAFTGILLLIFYMVRRYGAAVSVLPACLMPPISATIGALFLGEVITPALIAGAILVFFGLFLASQ